MAPKRKRPPSLQIRRTGAARITDPDPMIRRRRANWTTSPNGVTFVNGWGDPSSAGSRGYQADTEPSPATPLTASTTATTPLVAAGLNYLRQGAVSWASSNGQPSTMAPAGPNYLQPGGVTWAPSHVQPNAMAPAGPNYLQSGLDWAKPSYMQPAGTTLLDNSARAIMGQPPRAAFESDISFIEYSQSSADDTMPNMRRALQLRDERRLQAFRDQNKKNKKDLDAESEEGDIFPQRESARHHAKHAKGASPATLMPTTPPELACHICLPTTPPEAVCHICRHAAIFAPDRTVEGKALSWEDVHVQPAPTSDIPFKCMKCKSHWTHRQAACSMQKGVPWIHGEMEQAFWCFECWLAADAGERHQYEMGFKDKWYKVECDTGEDLRKYSMYHQRLMDADSE